MKVQQGIDIILKINDKIVAGQQGVSLNRQAKSIDITNKIDGEWQENIPGLKVWSVNCPGVFIMDSESFDLIEEAFKNNLNILVNIKINGVNYEGNAIVTDFPLTAVYNSQFKYNLKLLGNGELVRL